MDNLMTVALVAHNPARNHHRCYELVLGRDLLGHWTLTVRYGRVGRGGNQLRFASPKAAEIQAAIHDRLRRRLNAPKRIGCPYLLSAFTAASDIDATFWLPGDVLAKFLPAA